MERHLNLHRDRSWKKAQTLISRWFPDVMELQTHFDTWAAGSQQTERLERSVENEQTLDPSQAWNTKTIMQKSLKA